MNTRDSSTSTANQHRGPIPFLARSVKWLIASIVLALAACGGNGPLGPAENGPTIGQSFFVGECPESDGLRIQKRTGADVTVADPSTGCEEFEPEPDPTIR